MSTKRRYTFPPVGFCSRCGARLSTGHLGGWCGPCLRRTYFERQAYTFLDHPSQPWVLLDTETTGLKVKQDEVVDLAVLSAEGKVLFSSLIRPSSHQIDGSPGQGIHGIRDADVRFAPTLAEVWPALSTLFASVRQVITYNANFDRDMLEQNAKRAGLAWPSHLSWWCLMKAFAHWYGQEHPLFEGYQWQKLALACQVLDIETQGLATEHRALGDAQRAYAVLEALAVRAPEAIKASFAATLAERRAATNQVSTRGFWSTLIRRVFSKGGPAWLYVG